MKYAITGFMILLTACLTFSCTKKATREPVKPEPEVETVANEEIYLKEGFIARDTFRIVMLDCQDESYTSLESVEEKSEKRALATLQKYLLEQNRVYDNNTRAELINLIQNYGTFSRQNISHKGNTVYYLEIKKDNIKRYIDGIARAR
ncbi:MAG TPA: hypothetical protein PK926_15925 [Spirochaetota bacterium]|nr:hypothetical protein [Spirochaetota bacterium]HPI90820.1 hypothetical protein [Spirochaetota bacterium]HPR47642.1 hypothetical protein [Spirochaetota bacterium]